MQKQSTDNPRRVEALTPGEHITDAQGVHEVMHTLTYRNGDGTPIVALTLRPLADGKPWMSQHAEGTRLAVATPEDIREYRNAGERLALAEALRQLASDIIQHKLPLPSYSVSFSAGVVQSRADLDRWAAYLGAEVRGGTPEDRIPAVDADRQMAGVLKLRFHAQCSPEPEPAPAPLKVDAAIAAAEALERHDSAVASAAAKAAQLGFHRRDLVRVDGKPERWLIEGFQPRYGNDRMVVVNLVNPYDASEGTSADLPQLRHTTAATAPAGE